MTRGENFLTITSLVLLLIMKTEKEKKEKNGGMHLNWKNKKDIL